MDQPPLSLPAVDSDDTGFQDFLRFSVFDNAPPPPSSSPTENDDVGVEEGPSRGSPNGGVEVDGEAAGDVPSCNEGSNYPSTTPDKRRVSWIHDYGPMADTLGGRCYSNTDSVALSEENSKISKSCDTTLSGHRMSGSSNASSRHRSSTVSMDGFWSKMTRKSEVWDYDDDVSDIYDSDDENMTSSCWDFFKLNARQTSRWFRATMKTAFTSKQVAVPCLLLFVFLVVAGCLIVWGFDQAATNSRKQQAIAIAEHTDQFFSRVLENAFVPLFTISAFVKEVPLFEALDSAVGERCDPSTTDCSNSTSAPLMAGQEETHRNLTGLFETDYGSATLTKFNKIAKDIKDHSGLGRSLVAIELAPKAVVSLIYPLVNCEDFDDGYCMNNTAVLGYDILNDPNQNAIARKTVSADDVVTAGPLTLIQGGETFIARWPINFDKGTNHSMDVDGMDYPCWGLAVVLLNWQTLKEDSNIYKEFENKKMQFMLTRTDIDGDTGEENVVIIAQSDRPELIKDDNVTLSLDTGDNGWVISVGYDDGFSPKYMPWALPIIIASANLFTLMMILVLVSKKEHERLLGNLMPPNAINKLRKGEIVVERYSNVTIFFSDIVGYTNMSTQMTPVEVMQMLSDLYTQMDFLAKKHGVYKVETIGDAYIAIAGAPHKCTGPEAAEKMTLFALDALQFVRNFKRRDDGTGIAIRVGLASGPVVAGVIGTSLPKYTLFGDTVNVAARMEQTSMKMKLQICPLTHRMLLDAPMHDFKYENRLDDDGELGIEVKGKGRQFTYWVTGASQLDEKHTRKSYSFANGDENA